MNAAGIDVSSRKSTVAVLRPFGEVVHLPFDVAHSTEGLASLSKQLKALLEQSFPGIRKCFDSPVRSDGTQKWVDFAHTFWHVDCVRKQSYNAFSERYRKWRKRHGYFFKQSNAEEVYALAKNAVVLVPKSGVTKVLVQEAANQLSSTSRSVETYRAEMECLASMLPEYPVVMEMYGVGKSFGPQLMAEIGDVRRFERRQSLVAFAGIDPMPNQSGDKNVRSNKSSKRGSPYLRKTLFNVMGIYLKCASQNEPVFQFLDRKLSEGKPFYFDLGFGHNRENVAVKMHRAALVFGVREYLAHGLQHSHALVANDELHLFCASIAVIRPSAS